LPTHPNNAQIDYIKYSLDPEIKEAGITEQDKPDVYEKIKLWREELRAAIVDFEKAEPTREIVAECLRANYRQHPDNDPPERIERGVQRFMQETEPVAGLPPAAQFAALVHGFDGFSAFITRERGSRWGRASADRHHKV
jgi:hypothetical protein